MANPTLTIVVALKDNFTKSMTKMGRFIAGEAGVIGKSFNRVSKSVFNLRNLIIGGLAGAATKSFLDAFTKQEAAATRLANAMKLTGTFSEQAEARMHAFASSLQATTTIGDETALRLLSIATAMGQGEERAQLMVQAAADLSAATGKDLNSAFQQLLKSTGGLAGELSEVLPEVKALTTEQLKAGGAMDLVAKKFAGFAAGEAKAFGGQLTQIGNLWVGIKEKAGSFLAAIFQSGLGEWIKTTLVVLNEELAKSAKAFAGSDSARDWGDAMVAVLTGVAKGAAAVADGFRLMMKPADFFVKMGLDAEVLELEAATQSLGEAQTRIAAKQLDGIIITEEFATQSNKAAEALLAQVRGVKLTSAQLSELMARLQEIAQHNREYIAGTNDSTSAADQLAKMQDKVEKIFAKVAERIKADREQKERDAVATEMLAREQAKLNAALAVGAATDPLAGLDAQVVLDSAAAYRALAVAVADYDATAQVAFNRPVEFAGAPTQQDFGMTTEGPTRAAQEAMLQGWASYFAQVESMAEAWQAIMERTIENVAGGVANIVGESLDQVLRAEITTTRELGKALQEMFVNLARQILVDMVKMSIQMAIMAALKATMGAAAEGAVWKGGWTPVQEFASGGVVTRPTVGFIGEGGQNEAVVPLPNGTDIPVEVRGGSLGGGGTTVNLNVQAMDGASVMATLSRPEAQQMIVGAITDAQRRNERFRKAMRR